MQRDSTPRVGGHKKNGPNFNARHLVPDEKFCRRCLQKSAQYSIVEVSNGPDDRRDWIICNACVNRADHATWVKAREKDRATFIERRVRENGMKNAKYYIDPEKTDAAAAEGIAQAMNAERGQNPTYQICVGPVGNTTKTLFTPEAYAALQRREADLTSAATAKRREEEAAAAAAARRAEEARRSANP